MKTRVSLFCLFALWVLSGCGSDGNPGGGSTNGPGAASTGLNGSFNQTTTTTGTAGATGGTGGEGLSGQNATTSTTGSSAGGTTFAAADGGATTSGDGSDAGTTGSTQDGSLPEAGGGATGPKDGDPDAPVVEIPEVPCREESALGGFAFSAENATIDGRGLAIDYPCGKHEGAHMTVILNLHGTLIGGAPYLYQRSYFSAYRYIYSHNLIVVHPQSASTASSGAQWGNQDGGTDKPHLDAVMNWVYDKFSKFQIRSTWVAGHSWGAAYAAGGFLGSGYVCNEMFADQFKGVIGMSRLSVPSCADRVSMIGTRGETENIPLLDQSAQAAAHGCDTPMQGPEMIGNNERRYFDGCDPGWVHEDYNMLGKGHIDSMDAEVVEKIVDQIKSTEI